MPCYYYWKSKHWLLRLLPRMKLCYSALALFFSFVVILDAQTVCWHALVQCHNEPECKGAYEQYLKACEGNIRGSRQKCPSHCIGALVRLNLTSSGPALETCDCGEDNLCRKSKKAIEPCLPRIHPEGCTAARQRCEEDVSCHSSLTAYLAYCGQLFNGRKCSTRCKSTIQQMLSIPNGILLNQCVCDGVERPFCEVVKENMSKLCNIGDKEGGIATDQSEADYVYEDEDFQTDMLDPDSVVSYSGSPELSLCHALLLFMVLSLTL